MKSELNMTRGVVRVTATETQSLEKLLSVVATRSAVFVVRTYNVNVFGTLYIESSNQNTDPSDGLWMSVGSVTWTTSATDSNTIDTIVGGEDALLSWVRWRFVASGGSDNSTFEITGYGLD